MKSVHPSIRSSYDHKLNPTFIQGVTVNTVPVRMKHCISYIQTSTREFMGGVD